MSVPATVEADVLRTLAPTTRAGRVWIWALVAVAGLGATAYVVQLVKGLAVTGMQDEVSWGVYMTNFVFFIGISYAGTLISAVLRVTHAEWRRPITRMAEAITVFAIMVGTPMVIIDMGRPDRIMNVLAHGRVSSPILWDVFSIATYMTGSLIYLYVAMIPDLALCAQRDIPGRTGRFRQRLYAVLSLGYNDSPEHRRRIDRAIAAIAVVLIPVAISAHTVVSWIFGVTLRPGWHSTIFGPYFVIGAIFSGTAAILVAMAVLRKVYGLERQLAFRQFRNLGTLLFALNLVYIYFTLSEYLTSWYGGLVIDERLVQLLMGKGSFAVVFWMMSAFGLFLPAILLLIPTRRSITPIIVASSLIIVGMWLKRYLIVIPTMMTPFIPPEAAGAVPTYMPTWVEWAITGGGVAAFLLLFTLFSKIFPIVSIWETAEMKEAM